MTCSQLPGLTESGALIPMMRAEQEEAKITRIERREVKEVECIRKLR